MPKTTTADQITKLEAEKQKLDMVIKQKREQLRQQDMRRRRLDAEKQRKLDTRRKIILGGLVMAHMERDPAFAEQLNMLVRQLLNDRDKELFPSLFEPVEVETSA